MIKKLKKIRVGDTEYFMFDIPNEIKEKINEIIDHLNSGGGSLSDYEKGKQDGKREALEVIAKGGWGRGSKESYAKELGL